MALAQWLTFIGLLVGFWWQGYREVRNRKWDKEDRAELAAKAASATAVTTEKMNEIHVLVNSNLAAVKTELADAKAQIADMQRLIAMLAKERS